MAHNLEPFHPSSHFSQTTHHCFVLGRQLTTMPLTMTICPPETHFLFAHDETRSIFTRYFVHEEQQLRPSVSHDEEEAELGMTAAPHDNHQDIPHDPEQEGQRIASMNPPRSPFHDLTNVTNRRSSLAMATRLAPS